MKKNHLRVIQGGRPPSPDPAGAFRFLSGYVTDTRLMGVVVLYICWKTDDQASNELHQFFYYDAEEYGLETYRGVIGTNETELDLIEQSLIGGLGGAKQPVNEREARWLVQMFCESSRQLQVPLAEPVSAYQFILDQPITLRKREQSLLIGKICTPISGNESLIHYFLMRSYACDAIGANYLAVNSDPYEAIKPLPPATLYRNSIDEFDDPVAGRSFLCESLIEQDGRYSIQVLEIRIEQNLIAAATRRSAFRISPAEAAMQLNRPEYVTLYEILTEPDAFDELFLPLTHGSMLTVHDNGRLFLKFHQTNDHVNQKIFRLNDDIMGMYYVTDFGQLLLAAYTLEEIRGLERSLTHLPLRQHLMPAAKYEFKEPVLYEFIQSDCEEFSEFLEILQKL